MADLNIKRAPAVDANQRAWSQVYDDINDIIKSVNRKSTDEGRTRGTDGADGNVRLFKDNVKSKYFIEGKFKDGWAKRELLFTDNADASQDESINFSSTESYVKPDGSVPFTSTITGVAPSNDLHLATKGYVDTNDTDTTYTNSWVDSGNNALLRITPSSGSAQDLTITAGSNIALTPSGSSLTIAANVTTTVTSTFTTDTHSGVALQSLLEDQDKTFAVRAGDNINITQLSLGGGDEYLKIDCSINTSNFLGTGANRVEGIRTFDTDAITDTQSMGSGGYIVVDDDNSNVTVTFSTVTLANGSSLPSVRLNGAAGYTHPTSAGNKHIPSGGSSGQFLKYSSSGTAVWAAPSYTTNTNDYITGASISDQGVLTLSGGGSSGAIVDLSEEFLLASAGGGALTASSTHTLTNKSGNNTQWTNGAGYITGSSTTLLTNKTGVISMWTNDSGYMTASSSDTLTNKGGNISQWTNNSNYLTGNQTITLSGDAPGSGATAITVVVANDSHTHDTRYYTESEVDTSLALKSNIASPTFTGTVTVPYIRLTGTGDAAPGSTTHAFQSGPTDGNNVIIDGNEVMGRNNGAASTLHLQPDSGGITVNNNDGTADQRIAIGDDGNITCLNVYAKADVYAYYSSDPSLKANKELISDPLDKLSMIGGYSYDWKPEAQKIGKHLKGHDYGVMADEIETILPELVAVRSSGVKAVRYDKIIPLLIESIKELKGEIDGLRSS